MAGVLERENHCNGELIFTCKHNQEAHLLIGRLDITPFFILFFEKKKDQVLLLGQDVRGATYYNDRNLQDIPSSYAKVSI